MFDVEFLGFPRRTHHILLPIRPVRAARAGLALYDNTRLHQRLTRSTGVALLNLRILQRIYRLGPMPPSLLDQQWWIQWCEQVAVPIVGRVGHAAFRFCDDRIIALLMTRSSQPIGFVKVWRNPPGPLHPTPYLQSEALELLSDHRDLPFRVAGLLAEGTMDGWWYELFEPLPSGTHRPVEANAALVRRIFDAMHERLADLPRPQGFPPHYVFAHGDFSPRNVRRASDGRVWVLDWEGAGWAPRLGDELHFWTSEFARRVRQRPDRYGRRTIELLRQRGNDEEIREALRWERLHTPRAGVIAQCAARHVKLDGSQLRNRTLTWRDSRA